MLNAIIRFSVRNKLIIILLTLGLIIWGGISFKKLPIDAVPDITDNQVQVITTSSSLAAPEVERLITFPIEQATANIPGMKESRSFSRFGLSLVTLVFHDKTDLYWARQQVFERLQQVKSQIPADAGNPEMAPVTTGLGEIFQYAVKPKKSYEGKYSPEELRTIQDWIIRRQLLGVPGVADVSSFGGFLKQYEVAVNSNRLKSMNVTITEVFLALQKNNENTGGAYIEKGPSVLYIRSEGLSKTLADIEKIFVKHTSQGIPVYIHNVAEVRIGHAVRYGAMCFNDEGEVAGAVVMMLKGENSSRVIKLIKEKVKQIEKTLPEGVIIEPFLDRTKMVNNAISTVKRNLLEGALIVVFILVLFLGNLRAGLVVASVIPLSMLFAVIMMNLFGVSGNLMSLGALDFGLIVDGAVIIVEAVLHRLSHSRHAGHHAPKLSASEMNIEVEHSAGKMMSSAVFGQIIILIVYLPILTLIGIEGKMFRPMAQTVSFALVGAFILSLTYVPMISSWLLSRKIIHKENFSDRMMKFFHTIYKPVLEKALVFPKIIIALSALLFAISIFILTQLGGEFIPKLEEGDFAVDTRTMTGSSLSETIKATQKTAGLLKKRFPEVEKVVTKIGSGEIPTDPMPIEASDMMVILKDKSDWTSAKTFDELANKMSKVISEVPGVTAGFQYPVQMRFNELMTGARQDVVCKIFGEDLDTLAQYAGQLGEIVQTVNGAKDLYIETITGLPQIVIEYHRDAIARYQLTIADVNRIIRSAFAGESAGMIYENERRFDLVVRLSEQSRTDITDVQNLLIATPTGIQVPLYQVASVEIKEGPNQIQREDAKRRIVVGFNIRGRDVESMVNELSQKVEKQLRLPAGYYVTYGGQFENLVEARERLSVAVPAALLLILVLLYFAFSSLKYGLLIFSAIPLSAIGGVFALWARGMPFSISAGVGFIALFGVAVLNGIVLIAEFNKLKKDGMHDIIHIVREGTRIRLRPVLMTAAVASLGFLPMALSSGAGAEVQRPLATVVIGGLITATFLTLVVLPVLYIWVEKKVKRKRKINPTASMVILILLSQNISAQKTVSLDEMLKMASDKNLSLQIVRKEAEYWKQLQTGVFDPSKMQVGADFGNINSFNNDTRFFINQSFNLPVVYRKQKELYMAHAITQEQMASWKQAELHREVKITFYHLAELMERKSLLLKLDTVYGRFQQSAALRLKAGESNLLEKTTADAYLEQLKLQQQQLDGDMTIMQRRLQWLLNTDEMLLPAYGSFKKQISVLLLNDTSMVQAHPQVQFSLLNEKTMLAQTAVEKTKRSPDFSFGYNNLSFVGYQSPDGVTQKYYDGSERFSYFSLSLGIPIFNKATKSKIKASESNQELAKMVTAATVAQLKSNMQQLADEFRKQQNSVQFYEQTGLQQAGLIFNNANLTFEKGEISYLEWTLLMNNATSIQLSYIEAVRQYNQTLIQLEYLTSK